MKVTTIEMFFVSSEYKTYKINTDYEYIDCVKRGRNPKYETKTIHGYAEAFINLIEAPIVVNGKVI